MADTPKTITISLANAATATITTGLFGVPDVRQLIMQQMRSGGFFDDKGDFYPTSAILKISIA